MVQGPQSRKWVFANGIPSQRYPGTADCGTGRAGSPSRPGPRLPAKPSLVLDGRLGDPPLPRPLQRSSAPSQVPCGCCSLRHSGRLGDPALPARLGETIAPELCHWRLAACSHDIQLFCLRAPASASWKRLKRCFGFNKSSE